MMLILFLGICMWKIKFHEEFNDEFMSKFNTTAIKGVFVILVFVSHILQYIMLGDNMADKLLEFSLGVLGQNIVVVFGYTQVSELVKLLNKRDKIMCLQSHQNA